MRDKILVPGEEFRMRKTPATAITWFFKQVEYGIVLEDDCLPAVSFFRFCEELLIKYKDDERVMAISGTNFFEKYNTSMSYFFSVYGGNWGWASWKRAWHKFDYFISGWKNKQCKEQIKQFLSNENLFKYYSKSFDEFFSNPKNVILDYQWLFLRFANNGLSIIPSFNQFENIGFGADATHTFNRVINLSKLKTSKIQFPLQPNNYIVADSIYDDKVYEEFLKPVHASKINSNHKIVRRIKTYLKLK